VSRLTIALAALAALLTAVPSAAQVGSGKVGVATYTGIYTMSPDGSSATLIRSLAGCDPSHICRPTPRWSPDGTLIAFQENIVIKVMDSSGGNVRTLAWPYGLVAFSKQPWSPSSDEFTYAFNSDVFVAVVDGAVRVVAHESSAASDAAWSPTGSSIAYATADQLRLVDPSGGTPTTIASGPGLAHPAWSADGSRIAFSRSDGLWVVNADGSGLRRLVEDPGSDVGSPVWSPDGTKILFEKVIAYLDGWAERDVFAVDVTSLAQTRLTFDVGQLGGFTGDPDWSPDGAWITVHRGGAAPAGTSRVMNADGSCARDLGGATADGAVFWQPVPGGPALPEHPCHAVRVAVSSLGAGEGTAIAFTITVTNNGTLPVTGVRLRPLTGTDFSATSVRSNRGSCSLRGRRALCTIGRLGRGQSAEIKLRADGRRVSDEGYDGGWLRTKLRATARQALTDEPAASLGYYTILPTCTTSTPGGGLIAGTSQSEKICGRRGADRIRPGEGFDRIRAGRGNDVVYGRDHERDTISCGPGRDRVVADRRDVVRRDCERVSRR
jgi:uncharacterized repeat protein (TIGR01451 family)